MPHEALGADALRLVRRTYDALGPGEQAILRRCRTADEVLLEGAFWRVVRSATPEVRSRLAPVVACFPGAKQLRAANGGFRTGTFLRRLVPAKSTLRAQDSLRFRQLVECRDRDELVHRLRRVLTHLAAPVDWGVLGPDIYYWGDGVRRRWTQDFYAPLKHEETDHA